ncbi:MAG: hypothetical protein IMZ73_07745, partial [Chloroflexi bacterium]|nr:hypothetical protein [Chloroflexota bacterium]
ITYVLTIPPDALEESTPISLIPIETIDGLPFSGGLQGAVRIEPDGLMLDLPATLTISRADAEPLPDGMISLAFGFDGSGQEFHLMLFGTAGQTGSHPGAGHMANLTAAPTRAGPLADIALQQLKDYGIAIATPKQAAAVVKSHKPTAAESVLLNQLAYGEIDPELHPLVSRQRLAVTKLLSLAQSETPDWSQMTVSLAQLEILMNYYGKDPSLKADLAKALDLLLDRLTKMLKNNPEKCLTGDDPYAQAVARKILGAKRGSMYEVLKKKIDPQLLKDVAERRKRCVLALEINGKITAEVKLVGKHVIHVEGRVDGMKFNFHNGKVFLTGEGVLSYSKLEIIPERHPQDWCDPWIPDNIRSGLAKVVVTRLDLDIADVPNGVLQGVTLTPMTVTDSVAFKGKMTCTQIDNQGKPQTHSLNQVIPSGGSVWYGYFIAAHRSNPNLKFDVHLDRPLSGSAQPIIADLHIVRDSFSPGYGTWTEDSTFRLVDTSPK